MKGSDKAICRELSAEGRFFFLDDGHLGMFVNQKKSQQREGVTVGGRPAELGGELCSKEEGTPFPERGMYGRLVAIQTGI